MTECIIRPHRGITITGYGEVSFGTSLDGVRCSLGDPEVVPAVVEVEVAVPRLRPTGW